MKPYALKVPFKNHTFMTYMILTLNRKNQQALSAHCIAKYRTLVVFNLHTGCIQIVKNVYRKVWLEDYTVYMSTFCFKYCDILTTQNEKNRTMLTNKIKLLL